MSALTSTSRPLRVETSYMRDAFGDLGRIAKRARKALAHVPYDTLVGTGLSGALVVPRLAERLKVHWLIVRKKDDGSHSGFPVEGQLGAHWLFVDDFISTGATQRRVIAAVDDAVDRFKDWDANGNRTVRHETEFVGSLLYTAEWMYRAPVGAPYGGDVWVSYDGDETRTYEGTRR